MVQPIGQRRGTVLALLVVVLSATAAIYLSAGVGRAYFVADDFQWLAGGHTFTPARLVDQVAGDHFYRPAVDVWFAAAAEACGFSGPCYHAASLSLHLLNVALVFLLALSLFTDVRIAFLGALLFALEPGYTQAVVWVSAATALLMTTCYVGALLAQVLSWTEQGARRTAYEIIAALLFVGALFSHEAAITLPVVSWIMWREFGPEPLLGRRVLAGALTAGVALFAVMTVLANHRNAVFTESRYAIGVHAIQHALDYFVALYVGPGWWMAYATITAAIVLLILAGKTTRFGALWLVITVVPYLGFTWGNVSRYLYLPSIGFALAIAGAVAVGSDRISSRYPARRPATRIGFVLLAAFIVIRFVRFDVPSIRSQVEWTEPWRTFADALARATPAPVAGAVHVTPPPGDLVDAMYVEPMVWWLRQDYTLTVVVDKP